MKLVAIAALIAVCGAAKLDRTYLPPSSAATAGGNAASLQTPLSRSTSNQEEVSGDLPTGSYTNSFQGVVVDAATAGTRASPDGDQSGLGGPRDSYGSSNSKVGDAAFRGSIAGFRNTPTFAGSNGQASGVNVEQNFGAFESKSERPQSFKDRNSNIISYANDVSLDNYSYGFESDNGISVGENGVANNGIQAQGGYSYKGDDGQVYKVTYVADEGGYRPQGAHLPTPPPIPKEILVSLEQNAKDEAAGLVDDGSYDAKKYNAEGDYTHHNGGNIQYNGAQLSQFAKRPESDATASSTFINQNSQAFGKPQLSNVGAQSLNTNYNSQFNGNKFEVNNQNGQSGFNDKQSSQINGHLGQHYGSQSSLQFEQTQNTFGNHNSQFNAQKDQQASSNKLSASQQPTSDFNQIVPSAQLGGQSSQFESETTQVGSEQFDAQAAKPSLELNQSNFNSQQNLVSQFGNQGHRPQSILNSPVQLQSSYEKPVQPTISNQGQSQFPQSQFGISNANKPPGTFGLNKPSVVGQSQSNTIVSAFDNNGSGFSRIPNRFGAEYLPPFKTNDRPAYNSPQTNQVSSLPNANGAERIPDFIPLEGQSQDFSQGASASAFASVGPARPESKPVQSFNNFQSQPARPNKVNYNTNNKVLSSQQAVQSFGTKPTTIPDTELTTPLETSEKPSVSQGTQFNSQSTSSLGNFGSTPNNQSQTQISSQNTFATQQSTDQSSSPSFLNTRPESVSQFGASPTQSAFPDRNPALNSGNTQSNQNVFAQNQQNVYFSSQKPSNQGSDDSYYYNQPSKPFNAPIAHQGISRFPSSPSYQANGVASYHNNQIINQQSSQIPDNNFPSSIAPASPTSTSQTQTQGIMSTNYYNGVTQAAISPFPSVSPTHSSLFDTTQTVQFGSKPILNQSASVFNKPTGSQLQISAVPSFPSKPTTNFGQNPSLSFTQSQTQFGQSLTSSSDQPKPVEQSFSQKPIVNYGQTSTTSITQNEIQNEQTSLTQKDQPESPEINLQQNSSTQQYEGTIYEYNKPAEVLPPPEQSDSSSSQSTQTDSSSQPEESKKPVVPEDKPQITSQAPVQSQFNLYQGSQSVSQAFGNSPINHSQFAQNGQSSFIQTQQQNTQNLQGTLQSVKPNGSILGTTQFGQTQQSGLGFFSQTGSEPSKPFDALSNRKQFGQNDQTQHQQSGFISSQTQKVQPFRPFSTTPPPSTQFGQKVQNGLGIKTQNSESLFTAQSNKPFESEGSQLSSVSSIQQNPQPSVEPFKPLGTSGLHQGAQPVESFGTSETNPGFQGYPSSRPPFGSPQLTHSPFSQTSQQTFGASQIAAQPTRTPLANALPTKPSFNAPISGSQKPQLDQNTQLNNGNNQPSGSAYGQYLQGSQFGSTVAPQYGHQYGAQVFSQNPSSVQHYGSASSQAQFDQNSAQASSSASTQPGKQTFKPFSASSYQTSFQNKPQIDQAPQSSLTTTQSQGVQPFNTQSKPAVSQNKPSSQNACCGASGDSAIAPLNIGKPSQAFGLTQSQFIGFQGAQGFGAQTLAGKGEQFGGPRQPPSFDAQTGYHY